jgi:putative membrane protein
MRILIVGLLATGLALAGCSKNRGSETSNNNDTNATQNNNAGLPQASDAGAPNAAVQLNDSEKDFVNKAAQGGNAEVELGQLAVQKASDPDVKQFAQRMVDDHGAAGKKLQTVASSASLTPPATLPPDAEQLKQRISSLSGKAFDKAYMKGMVKDHTEDVSEFQKESTSAKSPDLKSFVDETLPVIQDHLKEAKRISAKLK